MDNDILVVRVNMFLKNKEQEAVRQCILEQRKTGIIVLPPYCEAIVVPKGVSLMGEKFSNVTLYVQHQELGFWNTLKSLFRKRRC